MENTEAKIVTKRDTAGVIAPPPLIFGAGLALGGLVTWFYPYPIMPWNAAVVLGFFPILFGLGVILTAWLQMRAAKTSIEPWHPTTAIVDTGVYALSRNPVYIALAEIYFGIMLIFNSFWFLPFLPLVMIVIHFGVVKREERYLESKFGDVYRDYMGRVKRWI